MDPAAFCRLSDALAFDACIISYNGVAWVGNFSPLLDSVESPVLSSVGTSDLLTHRGQETLRVEETSEPIGNGPVFGEPGR